MKASPVRLNSSTVTTPLFNSETAEAFDALMYNGSLRTIGDVRSVEE